MMRYRRFFYSVLIIGLMFLMGCAAQVEDDIPTLSPSLEPTLTDAPTLTPSPSPTAIRTPLPFPPDPTLPDGAVARIGQGIILDADLSPDESKLVIGSSIGVYLYDYETLDLIWFKPTEQWIINAVFSPSGKELLIEAADNIDLWDVETGEIIDLFTRTTRPVADFIFSPDGKFLIGWGKEIFIWDAANGDLIRTISGRDDYFVADVDVSPDGTLLVGSITDKTIHLWELESGEEIYVLPEQDSWVESVAFNPDGKTFATGAWGAFRLWDVDSGQEIYAIEDENIMETVDVSFSPDGKLLFFQIYGEGMGNHLRESETGEINRTLANSTYPIDSLIFPQDGETIIGIAPGEIVVWDATSGEILRANTGYYFLKLDNKSFSPDNQMLAFSSGYGVILWDMVSGAERFSFPSTTGWVIDMAFSPNGKILAAESFDDPITLWDTATGEKLLTLSEDVSHGRVWFSPDGRTLAFTSRKRYNNNINHTLKLWDIETDEEIRILDRDMDYVEDAAFSPDGKRLATLSLLEDTANTENGGEGQNIFTFTSSLVHYDAVKLWDVQTGEQLQSFIMDARQIDRVVFSLDGTLFVIGGDEEIVKLWNVDTGFTQPFFGHTDIVTNVALSPDGSILASGSWDKTIRLWDIATGEMLIVLTGHTAHVNDLAFSPDGTLLASGSTDGTILLWDIVALLGE